MAKRRWLTPRRAKPPNNPDSLLRSILGNGAGVLSAQLISFLSMTLVGRWYAPSDVGGLGIALAVVTLVSPLATLNFANAICIARTQAAALNLARLSMLSTLTLTVIALLALLTYGGKNWLESLAIIGVLSSAGVLATVTQLSFRQRLIRLRAMALVGSALVVATLRLVGGLTHPSGLFLIGAAFVGNLVAIFWMVRFGSAVSPKRVLTCRLKYLRITAKEYIDFPRYTLPHSLLRYAIVAMPPIALGAYFDRGVAGQYALAASVISGPILMTSDALGDAITRPLARAFHAKSTHALAMVKRLTVQATALAALPVITLWIASDPLFVTFFGEQWHQAAQFAKWLALWGGAMLATRPLTCLIPILGLQRRLLEIEVASAAMRLAVFAGAIFVTGQPLFAISSFAIMGAVQSFVVAYIILGQICRGTTNIDSAAVSLK